MSCVSPDAEACSHLPHLDGLVPAGGEDVVAAGQKGHAAHVVVVPVHCLQQELTLLTTFDIQYRYSVPVLSSQST